MNLEQVMFDDVSIKRADNNSCLSEVILQVIA
jgi:hypothetical protein